MLGNSSFSAPLAGVWCYWLLIVAILIVIKGHDGGLHMLAGLSCRRRVTVVDTSGPLGEHLGQWGTWREMDSNSVWRVILWGDSSWVLL